MQNNSAVEALQFIQPNDLDRKEWVSVTMSFKADGGSFEDWKTWNGSNWKAQDKAVWNDAPKNGAATLYYHANKNGYKARKLSKEELEKLKADRAIQDKVRAKQEAQEAKENEAKRLFYKKLYDSSSSAIPNVINKYFPGTAIHTNTIDLCPGFKINNGDLLIPYYSNFGEFRGVHKTYFKDGKKDTRKMLGKFSGDFVYSPITNTGANEIHIAEGLEDLLSVLDSGIDGQFIFMLNAGNLSKYRCITGRDIHIWGDADEAGIKAAASVAINNPGSKVFAHVPPTCKDWNEEKLETGIHSILKTYANAQPIVLESAA